ncbi:MAG TPA: Crp/Fnr family transcriptional regulator [Chitinophagaceae bacterium]|nr:Crp/Fnr family transcriptional regulator [Chitinophagaceae bacterium]
MSHSSNMDTVRAFMIYLQKLSDITEEEFNKHLLPVCKVRRFAKKEVITRAGEMENHFNFIVKGMARKFYKKGHQEINVQISMEGHMMLCQESFHSRQPSEYTIEAIEPTTLVSISYEDAETMFASSQRMEHLGRIIVTYSMVIKDKWQTQLIKMTPRERFVSFVTKNPELMQRVPQKYLASYLNIKPETFSRFKHLIRNHQVSVE